MYLKFFEAPNNEVVHLALMEFDAVRLRGTLGALPRAIMSMLDDPRPLFIDSPEDEEADRIEFNGIINLADMMLEIIEGVYANKNVRTLDQIRELDGVLEEAAEALEALQAAKDVRIAETHKKFGENFGAATGFQTHNYRDNAKFIREFVANF